MNVEMSNECNYLIKTNTQEIGFAERKHEMN